MRRAGIIGLGLIAFVAWPGAAQAATIASGHIEIGAPTTQLVTASELAGQGGFDSFFFAAPAAGTTITTATTDNGGFGYDLDLYFWDANGDYVDSQCQTELADEVCTVPAGAVQGEVAAWLGRDLDVNVNTLP